MRIWTAVRTLFRRPGLDAEMAEELRLHLELQIDRNVAAGMSPAQARHAARRQFGGVAQIEERCRDARGGRWWYDLAQDLRYGVPLLARQPGFTVAAVLTFALGIGATTAIYSVLDAVLLRPLAVAAPERLALAWETNLARNVTRFSVSYPNFHDWRQRSTVWEELAAFDRRAVNFAGAARPERLVAEYQTANMLAMLGLDVALGRRFLEGEDEPGRPPLAILSDRLWRRSFGADPQAIGRTIPLDGRPHTIVGVLPPGLGVGPEVEVILPLGPIIEPDRTDHALAVCGRLRPGVTLAQAEAELQAVAAQLAREHPDENAGWSVRLEPLFDMIVSRDLQRVLLVLLAAVTALLLIACANVSGLLLVRAATRTRELAIRTALGGGRGRLVRQLVTESVLLAGLGGAAGLLLAAWGVGFLRTLAGANVPRLDGVALDGRVLAIAWVVTLGSGVLAGVLPAYAASRLNVVRGLKDRLGGVFGGRRARHTLVVAQLALAIVLLAAAGLMVRTLDHLRRVDLGFDASATLTLRVAPQTDQRAFFERLTERIETLPDVVAVGLTNSSPMADYNTSLHVFPVGAAAIPESESIQAEWRIVNDDYFRALRIPVLRGRVFTRADNDQQPRRVVVNETLARRVWGDADPIGRELNPGGGTTFSTVIGVVGDIRSSDPAIAPTPGYYLSAHRYVWGSMTLVVRTTGDATRLAPAIAAEVRALDPGLPIFAVQTMDALVGQRLATEQLVAFLLALFAALALVLAVVGLYGVMAFAFAQRTREIGIRLALGATRAHVLRPLLAEGGRLIVAGVLLGGGGALALVHLLRGLLAGVSPLDPPVFLAAIGLLASTGLLACYLPARRATRVDPTTALRAE